MNVIENKIQTGAGSGIASGVRFVSTVNFRSTSTATADLMMPYATEYETSATRNFRTMYCLESFAFEFFVWYFAFYSLFLSLFKLFCYNILYLISLCYTNRLIPFTSLNTKAWSHICRWVSVDVSFREFNAVHTIIIRMDSLLLDSLHFLKLLFCVDTTLDSHIRLTNLSLLYTIFGRKSTHP